MPRLGQFTARALHAVGVTRIIHTGTFAIRELVSNTVITTTDRFSWTSDEYTNYNPASIYYSLEQSSGTIFYGTSTALGLYNGAQGYTFESWVLPTVVTSTIAMNIMGLQKGPAPFVPPAIDLFMAPNLDITITALLTQYVGGGPSYVQQQGSGWSTGTVFTQAANNLFGKGWLHIVHQIGPCDASGSMEQIWVNGYSKNGATKNLNPAMTITQAMTILELGCGWTHRGFRGFINEAKLSQGQLYNTSTGASSIAVPTSKFTTSTSTLVLIQPS
jgi:hypothetical protein